MVVLAPVSRKQQLMNVHRMTTVFERPLDEPYNTPLVRLRMGHKWEEVSRHS